MSEGVWGGIVGLSSPVLFLGLDSAISTSSKKQIADKLEELNIVGLTHKSLVGVAQFLTPYICGWINYYGRFWKSAIHPIFHLLSRRQIRWARRRCKGYKTSLRRAWQWYNRVREQFSGPVTG
ncbi:group II intron maturase-specific domain-containing protein [Mangrovibacterium marinum]|uniref:group II intron maturase-specific domain-containing protein n=1 Tax=Mangrovibacterium marinum TaxID=1639118 RepID=UPI000D2FA112